MSPCGLDSQVLTTPTARTAPAALAFDGATRNFSINSAGEYESAHPVDARVFTLLRTALGSIRSAPDVGQSVGAMQYIDQRTIRATVQDRVRTVLAPLLAAGEIRILTIDIDTETRGRVLFAVNYQNLVTRRRQTANVS